MGGIYVNGISFAEGTAIHAETTLIHAETTLIHVETSAIHVETSAIHAETTQIHVETSAIHAETTLIHGETSALRAYAFAKSAVAPTLAAGIAIMVSPDAAWTLSSAFATICASAVISSAFQLTGINIEAIATSGVYEIALYEGNEVGSTEVARCRTYGSTLAPMNNNFIPISSPSLAAGRAIRAKAAASSTGGQVTISVAYRMG